LSSNATVSITVTAVNDPPVPVNSTTSTPEDQAVTVTVATDIDSTVIHVSCTGAAGGTVTDNGDGSITYTPAANYNGPLNLSCTATDDGGASTATNATIHVTVNPVNDAPVAVDDNAEVNENANVTIDVVQNDTDVDGDTLTPTAISSVSPAGSDVVVNADRSVTFTPPANYTGAASFTYRANDGTASSANQATVSITVYPVLCSNETVSDNDGAVSGTFTRLTDSFECKRYTLDASATDDTVLFQPSGSATVNYRGYVQFAADPPPDPDSGGYPLMLRYDPAGGTTYHPVPWCVAPAFDGSGNVTSATIPSGETWCIASAVVKPNGVGDLTTLWQVYGRDDPKFTR
jgi:hypothetical protein